MKQKILIIYLTDAKARSEKLGSPTKVRLPARRKAGTGSQVSVPNKEATAATVEANYWALSPRPLILGGT